MRQLAEEAIQWTSEQVLAHLRACPAATAAGVLGCFIGLWRQSVHASGGASGCPVAGVAIDTGTAGDGLIDVARAAFRSWAALLAERLEAAGVPGHRATPIAMTALAGMEGALILCRAEVSSAPLETVAAELMLLLPPEPTHTGQ